MLDEMVPCYHLHYICSHEDTKICGMILCLFSKHAKIKVAFYSSTGLLSTIFTCEIKYFLCLPVFMQTCWNTVNPVWEDAFTFFIQDPHKQDIDIQVRKSIKA